MTKQRPRAIPRPCTCTTVRTTSRSLARTYEAALQETELNVTQLAVLRAVDRMQGQPLSRVADALSMERTSMYRALATMDRHGWVSLHDGPDSRSRSARITTKGRGVLDQAAEPWETVQTEIVRRFGRRRWQALVTELDELKGIADTLHAETISGSRQDQNP